MAWERRQRGGLYYTRSKREHGRVVREYVGTGQVAQLIAQLDELNRMERETTRAIEHERAEQQRQRIRQLDQPLEELDVLCRQLTREALEAAGYHQHHRGEWRRRRR